MQGVFSKEISALPHQTRRPSLHSHGHSLLRPTQPDYRWPDRTCDQGQGVPGHLGPSVRSTSERRGGHHGLEVDCGRHILFKVSLQSTLLGLASHHWMQEDLDYLDPATSQSFPLACGTLKTLDCRPTDTTQPRCTRLDHCFLCNQEQEMIDHIVASCSFSEQIWWNILVALGADTFQVGRDTLLSWWNSWRARWMSDKKRGADSLSALVV
jgi:hypothetical protein